MNSKPFTAFEVRRVIMMRRDGMTIQGIASELGRRPASVANIVKQHLAMEAVRAVNYRELARDRTSAALADRDRRRAAPRSLTAELMGDPEPGRSALDRRGPPHPDHPGSAG